MMDLKKTESTEFVRRGEKAFVFYCPNCKKNLVGGCHPSEVYRHKCPVAGTVFFLNGYVLDGVVEYNNQQRGEKKNEPKNK